MDRPLPAWFKADNVFGHNGNWYFGCQESLHVGPYRDRRAAEVRSVRVAARLKKLKTEGQRLEYVRKLLHEEWGEIAPRAEQHLPAEEPSRDFTPPPSAVRNGEEKRNWFRSERFFVVEGVWFFATREGVDVGPFNSKEEAKKHERRLAKLLAKTESEHQAHRVAYEYKHRPDFGSDIVYSHNARSDRRH